MGHRHEARVVSRALKQQQKVNTKTEGGGNEFLCLNKRMTDSLLNLLLCAHSEFTSCQLLASLTASPSQMQSLRLEGARVQTKALAHAVS